MYQAKTCTTLAAHLEQTKHSKVSSMVRSSCPWCTDLSRTVVSKAFQVLSDDNMRAAYDSNPTHDPESRFGGGGGGGGAGMSRGGGMRPGFATEQDITPEDLFNMFFGGGGGFELRHPCG